MDYRRLKDLPEELLPRERLFQCGPEALSNREILAILLRTGLKGENVLDFAERLLTQAGGLSGLARLTVHELTQLHGMGNAKAAELKAALELGRRSVSSDPLVRPVINSPQDIAHLVMEEMRYLDREHFRVVSLSTKNHVLGISSISVGSLNSSLVHPRECFKEAIRRNSNAIILLHNHPSGDPSPSREDLDVTQRLSDGGQILGIEVLDHVIIGDNRYISLKERGIL
ncbi:DNA replication and repair protein RadC [Desulfitobacterium dichloroeliminans LMG P-21439]|uniref:DNA replication and repair protein RadC n=1 Tax=Desulfitobacterium dichloroeliminans (strain LMG P-21439 / DCA1) TaxID=871963 RepID=L0FBS7_DESDL|nr:DNA repair protein RadC [Desulfitobacterium dichloroeliminans]AGA70470.1 DNA replication and repair protein RadC [Desulfitobacterium dichloroeliminans LMG P-21439]